MDYKKILRLHFVNRLIIREIAESCGDCGKTSVGEFLKRFRECPELSYPLPKDVSNEYLENLLYKKPGVTADQLLYRDFDAEAVYKALARKGETLKHLWQKYNAGGIVDGRKPMSYRQYCRRYSEWADSKQLTFHIQRYPGVNLELDFAGKTLCIHDHHNPEVTTKVTIFVAALTYSDYFYAEGMTECDIKNWIRVNNNALSFFGGVMPTVTPDNCKVAVSRNKDWVSPVVNKDFQAWAEYNGTVITPAKVRSPRWKPTVEGHVKIITMHILMDMDDMIFYSLDELNHVLIEKVNAENRRPFEGLSYSRYDLFNKEEKEIYVYNKQGDLIRTHKRSYTPKDWVVIPSDMPAEYKDYGYWNVPYFQHKAAAIGPNTRTLIDAVSQKSPYPVQSFRSCFGILRYAEKYSPEALERCRKLRLSG